MALLEDRNLTAQEQQQELCGFFGFRNQIIWDRYTDYFIQINCDFYIRVIYFSYPENNKAALVRKIKLIITDNGEDKKIVSFYNKLRIRRKIIILIINCRQQ